MYRQVCFDSAAETFAFFFFRSVFERRLEWRRPVFKFRSVQKEKKRRIPPAKRENLDRLRCTFSRRRSASRRTNQQPQRSRAGRKNGRLHSFPTANWSTFGASTASFAERTADFAPNKGRINRRKQEKRRRRDGERAGVGQSKANHHLRCDGPLPSINRSTGYLPVGRQQWVNCIWQAFALIASNFSDKQRAKKFLSCANPLVRP